jgi:fucose 4-O-acetylase-like acetyltransferase
VRDPAVDPISPLLLTFLTAVNQSYFMSAFFVLAGYFTPASVRRKGAGRYLWDRTLRLGLPILVYTTLIVNVNGLMLQVWMRRVPFQWFLGYQAGHLWFLEALLVFAVLYVLYAASLARHGARQAPRLYGDRFPSDRALLATIAALSLLTFAVRIAFPVGRWVLPGFQPAHMVHYAFSYVVGVLAYRGDWLRRLERAQARRWGIVALALLPLYFAVGVLGGVLEGEAALGRFLGGLHWQALAYAIWESAMCVGVLTFLFWVFRERLDGSSALLRRLAGSVYTVYILHQTVLIAGNILLLPVAIPTILKFVVVSLVAVPACFGLADLVRRIPGARRVLG